MKGGITMSEFYQMPLFVKLKVKNIEDSKDWYSKVLNFHSVFDFSDANGNISMVHLRGKKYQDLMLLKSPDVKPTDSVNINLFSNDINVIYKSALNHNTKIIQEPTIQPWNAKELIIEDIDGHIFTITESLNSNKSFDSVIDNVEEEF
uniref:Glyoxalase/bleomycin resistance/extradiol dioxygenase family protein n=2 Tax=Paraclostridium sordellii TaxID=1505 RepID=A0A2I6SVV0_PARSO|nr:glyoxalase/bleomycin resistance/extradiol dioxygenase family protein [Paeniclostridium sordellii]AUO31753.1 glyoxalase/bleomycin resistance/extradiol dioxygenase family protein [Paeniclostridium sordellii]